MAFIRISEGASASDVTLLGKSFVGSDNGLVVAEDAILINVTADANVHFTSEALQILGALKGSGQDQISATETLKGMLGTAANGATIASLVEEFWPTL